MGLLAYCKRMSVVLHEDLILSDLDSDTGVYEIDFDVLWYEKEVNLAKSRLFEISIWNFRHFYPQKRNLEGLYLALNDLITKEGRNADIINASRDSAKKADLKHISQKYFAKMDALDTIISKQKYP